MPLSLRQDLSHQKVNFFDDSNFPSRKHCKSPSFLRDSSFRSSRVCVPLSLRQDLSHQKVNFLDDSNFPSRKHCRSPSFLRHSSFLRSRVCVPLSLRQDLIHQKVNFLDDSNLPSRKHHRFRSPQGEADSYQLQLHPSHVEMWNAIRGLLYLEVPQVAPGCGS